jgi:hypothetical protein
MYKHLCMCVRMCVLTYESVCAGLFSYVCVYVLTGTRMLGKAGKKYKKAVPLVLQWCPLTTCPNPHCRIHDAQAISRPGDMVYHIPGSILIATVPECCPGPAT